MRVLLAFLVTTLFVAGCSQNPPTVPTSDISPSTGGANEVVGQDVGQPGQVRICHFPGHEGPVTHDFVTGVQDGGIPQICNSEGGLAMWVSRQACKEGHNAINRLGTDCDVEH